MLTFFKKEYIIFLLNKKRRKYGKFQKACNYHPPPILTIYVSIGGIIAYLIGYEKNY